MRVPYMKHPKLNATIPFPRTLSGSAAPNLTRPSFAGAIASAADRLTRGKGCAATRGDGGVILLNPQLAEVRPGAIDLAENPPVILSPLHRLLRSAMA
jgi:hypothetical protein